MTTQPAPGSVGRVLLGAVVVGCASLGAQSAAFAVDRFEIQVYEGDINLPGRVGLELHSNAVVPRDDERVMWRTTFEPSLGIFAWWEVGAYFQWAVAPGVPENLFGGFKLRSKFIVPGAHTGPFTLGLNIELGRGGAALGDAEWDTEFRPILAWAHGPWLLAFNPIFGWAVTGDRHAAPDFEPAAKARWNTGRRFGVGVEYFAGLGLVSQLLPRAEQEHVVFVVADLLDASFDLNLGVGRGLSPASEPWTVKLILGLGF